MKKSVLVGLVFLVAFSIVSSAKTASAQEFGVGYQFAHASCSDCGDSINFPLGFDANVAFPLMGPWNVIGDVSWDRHSETDFGVDVSSKELGVGGGLRYQPMNWKMLAVQAVVGINHESNDAGDFGSSSETKFMLQPGAVVMFRVAKIPMFAGVHYRRIFSDPGVNAIILNVGPTFGKK